MPLYVTKCTICDEPIEFNTESGWVHPHSGDRECWTGDGAVAYPPTPSRDAFILLDVDLLIGVYQPNRN